ncbi:MAG TPA: methyltransferase domain-containing protein [Vicinamibacterales bacterium]|jgi:2-polyprenyl-3-methyl-5-hydroxy-6-metoxy-1,4-benzoquinol methylase
MLATDSLGETAAPARTAPRTLAWLLLIACAAAMLAIGIVTSIVILGSVDTRARAIPATFWMAAAAGTFLTCVSLGLRSVRWAFLLRRTGVRIPLRDACIGYLSGFSLLFVPLLVGEIVVRAAVHRARARVPVLVIVVVNVWERLLDVAALAGVAAVAALIVGAPEATLLLGSIFVLTTTRSFQQLALSIIVRLSRLAMARTSFADAADASIDFSPLLARENWFLALASSVLAWMLPALALWAMAASLHDAFGAAHAVYAYTTSALTAGLMLAAGGVRVVGTSLIADLTASGVTASDAAIVVLGVRLVTAGLATLLGIMFVAVHLRGRRADASHFDEIAHAYDAQIPAAQRDALLVRKTTLMRSELQTRGIGSRGLDVGCGQGWYVARMRGLGFDVHGIDASAGQIALAKGHVDDPRVISEGSILEIAAPSASFDFAYCINVLHHLASIDEQRAAFAELFRVLKPGGLLFVHEINTRNPLFRFYMGYVFPCVNCIDEGTERWLLPHRLAIYTDAPVVSASYFTFMPEFVPRWLLALARPVESALEQSPLRVFSAHYMAVLQKPGRPA